MKISKGTKLIVNDRRIGNFFAIANSDFDTDDEWYDVVLDQEHLSGSANDWIKGEHVPTRNGISNISIRE